MTGIFFTALGWALLHSIWQMAIIWLLVQFLFLAFSNITAKQKSRLTALLLIIGFVGFVFTFFTYLINANIDNVSTVFLYKFSFSIDKLTPYIAICYLLFLLFSISRFIKNYRYVKAIKKYGLSKVNPNWRLFTKKMAAQLSIKKEVQIWFSAFITSPVTVGFLRPVILLPIASINQLSMQQVEAIILHELAHIKRNDYFINLIINGIKTILFFNPFVNALVHITEQEREKSCDQLVLQFQYPALEYASALLAIQSQNKPQKLFALPAIGRFHLFHRIELIMGVNTKRTPTKRYFVTLVLALLVTLSTFFFQNNTHLNDTVNSYASYINNTTPTAVSWISINHNVIPPSSNNIGKRIIIQQRSTNQKQVIIPSIENTLYSPPIISNASSINYILAAHYPLKEATAYGLKKYQDKQVKETIASSKKVVNDLQWKVIEQDLAEVFTPIEKAELKKMYEKELGKIDWNKWEQKLRASYNKIDWNNINTQLNMAVNNIRIDSIQQVYNVALSKLDKAAKLIAENELPTLPDTDITPELIQRKKKEALEVLRKITAVKNKKIVHL